MNTNDYGYNDWRNYLQHNWGNSPKMKAAEKKYNAEYYQQHKAKILAAAKERAGEAAEEITDRLGGSTKRQLEREKDRANRFKGKDEEKYETSKRMSDYLSKEYAKTPLGRAESMANNGRSAMEKARNRVNKAKSASGSLASRAIDRAKETGKKVSSKAKDVATSEKTKKIVRDAFVSADAKRERRYKHAGFKRRVNYFR